LTSSGGEGKEGRRRGEDQWKEEDKTHIYQEANCSGLEEKEETILSLSSISAAAYSSEKLLHTTFNTFEHTWPLKKERVIHLTFKKYFANGCWECVFAQRAL